MSNSAYTTSTSTSSRESVKSNYFPIDTGSDLDPDIIGRTGDLSSSVKNSNCGVSLSNFKRTKSIDQCSSPIECRERPPVVGCADSRKIKNANPITSSESEEEVRPEISFKYKPNELMFGSVNLHSKECCCEMIVGCGSVHPFAEVNEVNDCRAPTPSSVSSTSLRPLEWDSGADVGYYPNCDNINVGENELSSIEQIALIQGRKGIFSRSGPEGKSCSKKSLANSTVVNMIGVPTWESTPVTEPSLKSNNRKSHISKIEKEIDDVPPSHLFPEVIVQSKGYLSDSNSDGNVEVKNVKSSGTDSSFQIKRSSSFEFISKNKTLSVSTATFPRSQSNSFVDVGSSSTISSQVQKIINPPQSVSSSSVATVITGSPKKNSKCIQTSYLKNNVATQSSVQDKKIHSENNNNIEGNNTSTLESVQLSADDRVNSFEYLPGHMYESAQKSESSSPWPNRGVSLKEDVERGVLLLEEFIQGSNANNTLKKKELIQRVVKKLIQTDYPDDLDSQKSLPIRCATRRSQNKDGAVSEFSPQNAGTTKKPSDSSTSLSGQSSSPWVSVTESSKSSEPSYSKETKSVTVNRETGKSSGKVLKKSSSDNESQSKHDWKIPATKAEKLYESKRKGAQAVGDEKLIDFLNFERRNQLDWIVKEIDHLSNLKSLLEKHEKLRRNLQKLKHERLKKDGKFRENVKNTNNQRNPSARRKPTIGDNLMNKPSEKHLIHNKENNENLTWDSHSYDSSCKTKLKKSVSTETRREDIFGNKYSTAYTIIFEPACPKKNEEPVPVTKPPIADRQTLVKESKEHVQEMYQLPTLQDYLLKKRPEVVERAESRRKTLAELAAVRQLREEKRPVVLAAALSSEAGLMPPPPPPLVKRIVSQKEMRRQTERKYRQTFEVKKKVSEKKSREMLKTNRLLADVYNKRLQMLTLKGRTDLSNSIDVISTV